MPTYTIQEDAPWKAKVKQTLGDNRNSAVSTSSIYSDDLPDPETSTNTPASPIKHNTSSQSTSTSTRLNDQSWPKRVTSQRRNPADSGPRPDRTSKMPIFKQVRSMLSKPNASTVKWDEYSGEPSESGKPAQVKPSTYTPPYEGAFQARRTSPESAAARGKKVLSTVSVLNDEEDPTSTPSLHMTSSPQSPVSPITPQDGFKAPMQMNPNTAPQPTTSSQPKPAFKRKPINISPSATENLPPTTHRSSSIDSEGSDATATATNLDSHTSEPGSHFSWTTVAPSEAANRQSVDTIATSNNTRGMQPIDLQANHSKSRFSWSTVATNTTHGVNNYEDSLPPYPPPIPTKYQQPATPPTYADTPTQSILSRRRPIQRLDKEPFAPSPRSTSTSSRASRVRIPVGEYTCRIPPVTTTTASGKALPLPPLTSEKSYTHLEALLGQEKNLALQRRNVAKSIREMEAVEKASPLEVSFATVRDARKKLEERRGVLDEIKKEEMELGIKIARARRKEDFGDGEGTLWVRRVTG